MSGIIILDREVHEIFLKNLNFDIHLIRGNFSEGAISKCHESKI